MGSGYQFKGKTSNMFVGTGSVGTTAEALDEIPSVEAGLGIRIRNLDTTESLLIGKVDNVPTTTTGYTLPPGESEFFEITDTANIRVIASANTCDYSWIQY